MGIFGCLILFVIDSGEKLRPVNEQIITSEISNDNNENHFFHNLRSPFGLLLLEIIAILAVSKVFGFIITKIGQPSVIGEMIAGIVLGPSIMGFLFPEIFDFLFPLNSLANLEFLSQIGLAFFMFIIGMELDLDQLKNKTYNAIVISNTSIIFPYFLGVVVSYFLYEQFAPANVSFTAFALFIGISVSITAFPVLARILQERGLTKTSLGAIVIASAAFNDVTAWCILVMVIAIIKAGSIASALLSILFTIVFILLMFYAIRPWIKRISDKYANSKNLNKQFVVTVFFILLVSACITETIGIHALFGAFLAGVIMPKNLHIKELLMAKIEDVSILLLLPIFFAITGLKTQIGLLNEGYFWIICLLIIFIAVLGKLGGSAFAAKMTGYTWRESFSIGALMNTRGLMELIVLNIGYDLGILTPTLFTILVLMALATTFMTGPLLDLIDSKLIRKR
ncbi:MAG: hypothetical protein A2X18_02270 [Bacteroidetes bacterium GWF2_40_14]|nr:MAG: hypothetical protein A2X18_02270 [Bacteroidetes bacterium GWF2_40_14]